MDRTNHYEAAFEGYLQRHHLCYVAVDETRRAYLGESRVKNLDFIVHSPGGASLLVDVKGRRFPTGRAGKRRRVWQCWCDAEDVTGLLRWAGLFGPHYQPLLVFTYHILPPVALPEGTSDLWVWRGRRYLFRAVPVEAYHDHMRVRSPRWGTVDVSGAVFRELVRPFREYTCPGAAAEARIEEYPF